MRINSFGSVNWRLHAELHAPLSDLCAGLLEVALVAATVHGSPVGELVLVEVHKILTGASLSVQLQKSLCLLLFSLALFLGFFPYSPRALILDNDIVTDLDAISLLEVDVVGAGQVSLRHEYRVVHHTGGRSPIDTLFLALHSLSFRLIIVAAATFLITLDRINQTSHLFILFDISVEESMISLFVRYCNHCMMPIGQA